MKNGHLKEIFTGRRNIFTVTAVFIGGYMVVYPTVNAIWHKLGSVTTVSIGLVILVVGDYILDSYHKD